LITERNMKMTQNDRNKRWRDKNREHVRYTNARSSARGFINNRATREDLEELITLIHAKLAKFVVESLNEKHK